MYEESDLASLVQFIRQPAPVIHTGTEEPATVENPLPVPVTQVVRVSGGSARPEPYHVFEFGEHVFRGAQPSLEHPGDDYVKVYLPPGGRARIAPWGYIDGVVRAGWGAQYTLGLSEVEETTEGARVTVDVKSVTSLLFAPRVQFAFTLGAVRVDGAHWHYHDDRHVFLPNHVGTFRVEATRGEQSMPHLVRTFANVTATTASEGQLDFEAQLPPWSTSVPPDFHFYALVRHPEQCIVHAHGAEVVRNGDDASVVRFRAGHVSLAFSPGRDEAAHGLPVCGPTEAAWHWLRWQPVEDLRPHLEPFENRPISLRADTRPDWQGCDVLVWYPFYHDEFPSDATGPLAGHLRAFVRQGGGLLLLEDATRVIPQLVGVDAGQPSMRGFTNRFNDYTPARIRVAPAAAGHPLFSSLIPTVPGAQEFDLVRPDRWDVFKVVSWDEATGFDRAGRRLASVAGRLESEFGAGTPCTWEFSLGEGRILAHALSLRRGHGTRDMWPPSENELALVRNFVCHAAPGKASPIVGVLW